MSSVICNQEYAKINYTGVKSKMRKTMKKNISISVPSWFDGLIKTKDDVLTLKEKILVLYKDMIVAVTAISVDSIDQENAKDSFDKTYRLVEDYRFRIQSSFSYLYWYLHLDANNEIKAVIQQVLTELEDFIFEHFTYNKKIYRILKKVGDLYLLSPQISLEEKKLIDQTFYDYKKMGIDLPEEKQAKIKEVSLALSHISREFELHIQNQDNHIIAKKDSLAGLTETQLNRLKEVEKDTYRIGVDYPTFDLIMRYCSNQEIRKDLYIQFNSRAYPQNVSLLKEIRTLAQEYAHLVGSQNYAVLDIELQMAKTVKNVEDFLLKTKEATRPKAIKEKALLTEFARRNIFHDPSYIIHPWDITYIYNTYEEQVFGINAEQVSQYFPVKKTIQKMIDLYSSFFGLEMEMISYDPSIFDGSWHMFVLQIKQNGSIKGHLLFDLYPREGKYSHACFATMVSSVFAKKGEEALKDLPIGLIIANFNKPTDTHDGLMKYDEARTLFHEMGHAMHHFLATTEFVSHSGTSTLHDFVEVPSQLFEQWFLEESIIQNISSHYLSGEQLPIKTIKDMIKLEFYNMGLFIQRQINSSLLSLYLFAQPEKDVDVIREELSQDIISLSYHDKVFNQWVYSFGHITPGVYGPKYYVYLWSLVYAIDFFQKIKESNGLSDKAWGNALTEIVLKKAGFEDPEKLSNQFLQRDLSFDTFYKYLNR